MLILIKNEQLWKTFIGYRQTSWTAYVICWVWKWESGLTLGWVLYAVGPAEYSCPLPTHQLKFEILYSISSSINDAIITASNSEALMANYRFSEQNQIELAQTCHKPIELNSTSETGQRLKVLKFTEAVQMVTRAANFNLYCLCSHKGPSFGSKSQKMTFCEL